MKFKEKVENTHDIEGCYYQGLNALRKSDRQKIFVNNTRNLNGSVDIDTCLKEKYPHAHRWDYVLGYSNSVYFVEIHPAKSSEIQVVADKLKWLKDWKKDTPFRDDNRFFWIAAGKIRILPRSKDFKKIHSLGINLIKILHLQE